MLVLAPTTRDARITCDILRAENVVTHACANLDAVCQGIAEGAGAVLITEEAVAADRTGRLFTALSAQPGWSDIPVIVLVHGREDREGARRISLPGSVMLDRPVRMATLASVVGSALRARTRQYQIRGYLAERARADRALAESEARYRAVGETIPYGAWVADAEGRFLYLSDAFLQVLGLAAEDALRDGWFRRLPPGDRDRAAAEWHRDIATGRMFGHEYRVVGVEGDTRDVMVRGVPLRDAEGRITSWVGMNLDITDRRRVDDELDRIGRLESVAVLASGIAHDFNNILTAIVANVSLARRLVPSDERAAERLDAALKAGAHAQKVVRQLLTFARGGAPVRRPVDLRPVIEDAVAFALQGSALRGDIVLAEGLPAVDADAAQVGQVIQNLVINAAQASAGAGFVRVAAHQVDVQDDSPLPLRPGPFVVVSVIDDGAGIDPADLHRIFDPFFTRKAGGSGLGLATAHSIVQRHGGHITARSTPGHGTTVQFYLPVSSEPAEPAVVERPIAGGRHGRVLVMDDDPAVRDIAQAALVHLGYSVEVAADGTQAIARFKGALAQGCAFDVVVLDLTVPGGMGGRETLVHLRRIDPTVCAIVASGYSNDPVMADHRAYGFRAAVEKPYDVNALGAALARVLVES